MSAAITMSMSSFGNRLDSLDDDGSEPDSLQEMSPMSIAFVEGKPIRPTTGLQEVGPMSMAFLTAGQAAEPTRQEVNGKEDVPVPQPRPRKIPPQVEEKKVAELVSENTKLKTQNAELAQQLDREKRENEAKVKQHTNLITSLTAQLEVQRIIDVYRDYVHL